MGLRFRKSITLCKGINLNIGKSGMSISVGGKGFRKTFNTKGQVTTSYGIPGTGIYYTETQNINGDRKSKNRTNANRPQFEDNDYYENREEYGLNSSVEDYFDFTEQDLAEEPIYNEVIQDKALVISEGRNGISLENIKTLYMKSDEMIDWAEILVSFSPDDVFMEPGTWEFLKENSRKVISGDIDTYLKVIETMRPMDDLLEYGSDFEFGAEVSNTMEVEFRTNIQDLLLDNKGITDEGYEDLFSEYVSSFSIRVARDLFALLPVKYVIVCAKKDDEVVLQARFDKNELLKIDFRKYGSLEIIERFRG